MSLDPSVSVSHWCLIGSLCHWCPSGSYGFCFVLVGLCVTGAPVGLEVSVLSLVALCVVTGAQVDLWVSGGALYVGVAVLMQLVLSLMTMHREFY